MGFGKPGEVTCPEVIQATHQVIESCKRYGVSSGTAVGTIDDAVAWARAGAQFLIVGTDLYLFLDATTNFINGVRGKIPELIAGGDIIDH
jgi:2-keto-3-deoxy-L-rhamnonate aldolase RhmA